MLNFKTVRDINLKQKRVLVRVDYNVSLRKEAQIIDDFRLKQSLETLNYLLGQNCVIYLTSHLGRPKGEKNLLFSLKPVAKRLAELLKKKVSFFNQDYLQEKNRQLLAACQPGEVVLLENLRFYPGEENNDLKFTKELALLADIFINDAFGVCHRHHASVVSLPKYLPAVAGLLLEKEVSFISQAVIEPKKPVVAIIGGAKMEDKLPMIGRLIDKADYCLIGGKIGCGFLKVKGERMGRFFIDEAAEKEIKDLFFRAAASNTALILPIDAVRADQQTLDIGPKSRKKFGAIIKRAKTIIWVGPLGFYEKKEFSQGTEAIYKAICRNKKSLSLIGGGDTMAALKNKKYLQTIDHVSTGGGALLEFIEKGTLPGIEALISR